MKTDLHSALKRKLEQHGRLNYEVIDSDTLGNVVRIWSEDDESGPRVEIIRRNISDTVNEYSVVYRGQTLIRTSDLEMALEKADKFTQINGYSMSLIDLARSAFLHQYADDDHDDT